MLQGSRTRTNITSIMGEDAPVSYMRFLLHLINTTRLYSVAAGASATGILMELFQLVPMSNNSEIYPVAI